jgi:hypothetical protein
MVALSKELDPSFGAGVFTSGLTTGQFNGVTDTVNKVLVDGSDLVIAGAFISYSRKSSASTPVNTSTPRWIRVDVSTNTESIPTQGSNGLLTDVVVDGESIYFCGNIGTWGGVSANRYVKADRLTGVRDAGFNLPAFFVTSYIPHSILIFQDKLFAAQYGGFGTIDGQANQTNGLAVFDKTTGVRVKSYNYLEIGYAHASTSGSFFEDGNYIYAFLGRNGFLNNTSGVAFAVRRFSKTDLSLDTSWGFGNSTAQQYAATVIDAGVIVGTTAVFGGSVGHAVHLTTVENGGRLLEPPAKLLYAMSISSSALIDSI